MSQLRYFQPFVISFIIVCCQNFPTNGLVPQIADADEVFEKVLTDRKYKIGSMPPAQVNGEPVIVKVGLLILSIDEINDMALDFTIQAILWQEWVDPRLEFNHTDPVTISGFPGPPPIWIPDLYFQNEKLSHISQIMKPNKSFRIYPNGTIFSSTRLSVKLSCSMEFRYFPMDHQQCFIRMSSYAFTRDKLELRWTDQAPVRFEEGFARFQKFDLIKYSYGNCTESSAAAASCLQIKLNVSRQLQQYMSGIYAPTALFVFLSWLSFWLGMNALEARMSLGITTLLTMSTNLAGVSLANPNTPYTKALDFWLGISMNTVAFSICEVAYLIYLRQGKITPRSSISIVTPKPAESQMKKEINSDVLIKIDLLARKIFPGFYFVFNLIYWSVLLFLTRDCSLI